MTLSDEELSRWIAERLEPWGARLRGKNGIWRSLHDFWISDTGYDAPPPKTAFKPRDLIHDPAMTVMLIKKLMAQDTDYLIQARMMGIARRKKKKFRDVNDLGRAVAEAWAIANGWKAEGPPPPTPEHEG